MIKELVILLYDWISSVKYIVENLEMPFYN